MGSVLSYETRAGKRYRVLYRRPDGSQAQKRGFTTKRSAELYLAGSGDFQVGRRVRQSHRRQGDRRRARRSPGCTIARATSSLPSIAASSPPGASTSNRSGRTAASAPSCPQRFRAGCRHSADHTAPRPSCASHGVLAGILDVAVRDRRLKRESRTRLEAPQEDPRGARLPLTRPGRRAGRNCSIPDASSTPSPTPACGGARRRGSGSGTSTSNADA